MKFEQERLLELAGIPGEKGELLNESVNKKQSQDTLIETKLRSAIRREIADIFEELNSSNSSGWMHKTLGKPQASSSGRVTRGFLGLGFK